MKKLHTLLLIAAFAAFGLLFAAFDNSSPPTRAEKAFSQSETAQTVHADFVQSENFAQTGDILISTVRENRTVENGGKIAAHYANSRETPINRRRAEIESMLSVISEIKNKPPERFDVNQFTNNLTAFKGFSDCDNARAKI